MRIAVFPGSFNPVHIGHLAMANFIAEFEDYDQVWFLITPHNPMKKQDELLDEKLRLEMLEKAIIGYEKFQVCTLEWEMPKPTYTVNTLQRLRMTYPENTFELVIGSDNWESFHRWKDYQIILKNFKIVVYPRRGTERIYPNHPNVRMLPKYAPMIDISSTTIRKSISKGKDVRFYMPTGTFEMLVSQLFFNNIEEEKKEENNTQEDN